MGKTDDNELINLLKGVDWNLIQETNYSCNTEREQQNDVLIAKGTSPDTKQKIDYRERSPFTIVKKGEVKFWQNCDT